MSNDTIPPNIADWVRNLFDPTISHNVRENYRDNLERVMKVAQEAIFKFDRDKNRAKPQLVR